VLPEIIAWERMPGIGGGSKGGLHNNFEGVGFGVGHGSWNGIER